MANMQTVGTAAIQFGALAVEFIIETGKYPEFAEWTKQFDDGSGVVPAGLTIEGTLERIKSLSNVLTHIATHSLVVPLGPGA